MNGLEQMICLSDFQNRLSEIDEKASAPNFWSDHRAASQLMKERQKIYDVISRLNHFKGTIEFYHGCYEICPADLDFSSLTSLEDQMSQFELQQMMDEPTDTSPAIVTISAGAGGLESANWVSMLLRMYGRYADLQGFKVELLDLKHSEEHSAMCIDSASIRIEGNYAYGFLKGETGVHRLIRNSPFSSSDARHTSFAAISVTPDIEDIIEIKIDDKDMDITAQAAGGPGGQNVNAVNSACRIKHIPTGINILVRSERDFHKNKSTALKMLKAKLYDLELKKKNAVKEEQLSSQSAAAFGSQIRTTTLTPYSLVKDHRTGHEIRDAEAVLDGDIQSFIVALLQQKK